MLREQKPKQEEDTGEKLGVLVFPLTEECRLFVEGLRKNPFLNINTKKNTTITRLFKHILKKFFHIGIEREITNKTSFFEGAGALTVSLVVANRERTSILHVFKQKSPELVTCASLLEKYPHILDKESNKIKLFFNLTPSNSTPKELQDSKEENGNQSQSPASSSSSSSSSGGGTPITIVTVTTPELHKREIQKTEITPFFVKKEEEDNNNNNNNSNNISTVNKINVNTTNTTCKKIQIKKVEEEEEEEEDIGDNFHIGDPQLSPISPRPVVKQEIEKCNFECVANENSNSNFFDHSDIFNSRRSFYGFAMDEKSLTSLMMEEAEEKRKMIKDEASFFVGSNKIERSQQTFLGGDSLLEPHSCKIPKFF